MPKEPYKMVGHVWEPMKGIGKQRCKYCGLVALRNPLTQWCIDKGCNHEDHPQYEKMVKKLGGRR